MSWFNTSGFANIAKSALSQAQKTIDRALEINNGGIQARTSQPAENEDAENFFAAFGLDPSGQEIPLPVTQSSRATTKSVPKSNMSSSNLWGSFSGSFFDPNQQESALENADIDKDSVAFNSGKTQTVIASEPKLSKRTESESSDAELKKVQSEEKVKNAESMESVCLESAGEDNEADVMQTCSSDSEKKSLIDAAVLHGNLNHPNEDMVVESGAIDVLSEEPSSSDGDTILESIDTSTPTPAEDSFVSVSENATESSNVGQNLSNLSSGGCESDLEIVRGTSERVADSSFHVEISSSESLEKSTDSSETIKDDVDPDTTEDTSLSLENNEIPQVNFGAITSEHGWGWESGMSAAIAVSTTECVDEKGDGQYEATQPQQSGNQFLQQGSVCLESSKLEVALESEVTSSFQIAATEEEEETECLEKENPETTEDSVDYDKQLEKNDDRKRKTSPAQSESSSNGRDMYENKEINDSETKSTDSIISVSSSTSSFVKCMIEEAMGDHDIRRPHSPHSTTSSDKSDMVKMESEQNSGQTSGDEIETTTSSDIEIISISSPNGDGLERSGMSPIKQMWSGKPVHSSRFRRADRSESPASDTSSIRDSPMTRRPKHEETCIRPQTLNLGRILGENQKSSETSSEGDHQYADVEKMVQRLGDMTEILRAREERVLELSRENVGLQDLNTVLRKQVHQVEEAHAADTRDVTALTEEFSQRLATMERNLQQALREKESLKKEVDENKEEIANSLCAKDVEEMIKEKDTQIQELMQEGEKLSKQHLQQSNIIKKLRAKEKEHETLIKQQKQKLEDSNKELERVRKALTAKEDIERKQIDAVRQLTNTIQKQEKELATLKSDLEDAQEKNRSLKTTLDSSYKEYAELHRAFAAKDSQVQEATLSAEMAAKEELRANLEKIKRDAVLEQEALVAQIEDLRQTLTRTEQQTSRREDTLRQEIADLQQRLQEAEGRNQDLAQNVSAATRPLLRQIENIQSTFSSQTSSWEKLEHNLTHRLNEAQSQLSSVTERERSATERYMELSSRVASLETQNNILRQEKTRLQAQLETEKSKLELLEAWKTKSSVESEALQQSFNEDIKALKREAKVLEHQLEIEKTVVEAERRKSALLQDQLKEKERKISQVSSVTESSNRNTPSPTPSLSRFSSVSETFNPWLQDDILDHSLIMSSSNGHRMNLYDSVRHNNPGLLIEGLQSQLKMREGEIVQLQNEISQLERVRESMAQEMVRLSTHNEDIDEQLRDLQEQKNSFQDMEQKYNALLQMYGEKVEEADELRLDLVDIKEMYKVQINDLLKKLQK